jgi:lipopolysaccharide biosynthesis protein
MHYSKHVQILQYVSIYIRELSKYFDQVIFVSNHSSINKDSLSVNQNVSTLFVKNEGYDFGMFYKAFKKINPSDYQQIACINDSNILFGGLSQIFQWGLNQHVDFWGLIDSNETPWFSSHQNNYHIQSHFLVFNKNAIKCLPSFLDSIDTRTIFSEKDPKQLRRLVIDQWEIGLSQFLLNNGLKSASYCNSENLLSKYRSKGKNITHSLYKELIKEGYPLLKKKIVLQQSWRSIIGLKEPWEKLMQEYSSDEWKIPVLIHEIRSVSK